MQTHSEIAQRIAKLKLDLAESNARMAQTFDKLIQINQLKQRIAQIDLEIAQKDQNINNLEIKLVKIKLAENQHALNQNALKQLQLRLKS